MPWDELRAAQQSHRRAVKRVQRGETIGKRYCLVCLRRLLGGDRTTRHYCSDACRQKAHRLRRSDAWAARLKLHALHQRCLDRLVLAAGFERLRGQFNVLCHLRKFGVGREDPKPVAELMVAAYREQKRTAATERTMSRVYRRVYA
jgi:hypothetical protein